MEFEYRSSNLIVLLSFVYIEVLLNKNYDIQIHSVTSWRHEAMGINVQVHEINSPNRFFTWKKVGNYLLVKLAGSGSLMAIFAFYILMNSRFHPYPLSETLSNASLWGIAFLYAPVCSIGIDGLTRRIRGRIQGRFRLAAKVALYFLAGYAFFLYQSVSVISIIAGTVGAVCSLMYYAASAYAVHNRMYRFGMSLVLPLLLLAASNMDFSTKKNWAEQRTDSSYTASFDYFKGRQDVPIPAKAGQTITFEVKVDSKNGGGYGYRVAGERGTAFTMSEGGVNQLNIIVNKTGIYRIVLTGDRIQGSVEVKWTIH